MLTDIMNRKLVSTEPMARITEVAKLMAEKDVGTVLVLDNGEPRGIITDRDIVLRCVAKNVDVDDCTVENIMTESLYTVKESDGLFDCIETIRRAKARRIPVVNKQGKAVGIISYNDILRVLSKEFAELTEVTNPSEGSTEKAA